MIESKAFAATEVMLNGKRAIKLVAQDYRQKPKIVNLLLQEELPGSSRFPVAYEYLDVPLFKIFDLQSPRDAALLIVAAPGVGIHLENWPKGPGPQLEIFRVQDPEIVPPQATTIVSSRYLPPQEINMSGITPVPGVNPNPWEYRLDYFFIETKPEGIVIIHPHSTYSLTLEFPSSVQSPKDDTDAKSRYCYQVVSMQGLNGFEQLLGRGEGTKFLVVKTPNIKVTLKGGPPKITAYESMYKRSQYFVPFRIFEAPNIGSIPAQGTNLVPASNWRELTQIKLVRDFMDAYTSSMIRSAFSSFPFVGELIDIAEFALASATGKDFLGAEMTKEDIAFMGLSIVYDALPLSSFGMVSAFRQKASIALKLRGALKKTNLTSTEQAFLKNVGETLRTEGKLSLKQSEILQGILNKLPPTHSSVDTLINAQGKGFTHIELQEGYRTYLADKLKKNEPALGPKDWAKTNTSGKYSDIFVSLLGSKYRSSAVPAVLPADEVFNLTDVMRPIGYTDDLVKGNLKAVTAQRELLEDRLAPLLDELHSEDQAVAYMARQQMSKGRFNNVKGVVGEVLAIPTQRKIHMEQHPDALLFTGVTMKRKGASSPVLFSDNIIAKLNGNDLEIKVLFEVKAGKRGGSEATSQIFEWIEGRLEPGDQMIIPKGSKYYDAKGVEQTLTKEIRVKYGYQPTADEVKAGVGTVQGLANADRTMIVSKGTSLLGLNAEEQVAAKVIREELPLTSSEIDYLGVQLVGELGKSSSVKIP